MKLIPTPIRRRLDQSEWLNKPTTRRAFIPPYILLTAGLISAGALFAGQSHQADSIQDHDIEVNAYISKLTTYTSCVDRSQARDDLRAAMIAIFDYLAALADRLGASDIAADTRAARDEFLDAFQAIDITVCGVVPVPPDGVTVVAAPPIATTTTVPTNP